MIYKITNRKTGKQYVGQTVTHRKNKNKYRPFGHIGRFNDHVSEAINNTKTKQCTYLNNAIRKYGEDNFDSELLEMCDKDKLDSREKYYIKDMDTMYPKGYNLTQGGKTGTDVIVNNNSDLNEVKKRGREFGYIHKDSTKKKMSQRLSKIKGTDEFRDKMRNTMRDHYDQKKIEILSQYKLKNNIESYIRPVKSKETGETHDYVIRINRRTLTVVSKNDTLEEKYDRLLNILQIAKDKQNDIESDTSSDDDSDVSDE